MRIVTIPKATTLLAPVGITPPSYSLATMLDEFVWTKPEFREAQIGVFERSADLLADAIEGATVEIADADHEQIAKHLRAAEFPHQLARRLNRIAAAFLNAATKPSDPVEPKP